MDYIFCLFIVDFFKFVKQLFEIIALLQGKPLTYAGILLKKRGCPFQAASSLLLGIQ